MLEKIKEFFRNIFGINNKQYIEAPKEDVEPINNIKLQRNINFKDEIAVTNEEEKRILKLQRDFKAGLIEEEDLSEEDFNLLIKLYQISKIYKVYFQCFYWYLLIFFFY